MKSFYPALMDGFGFINNILKRVLRLRNEHPNTVNLGWTVLIEDLVGKSIFIEQKDASHANLRG